MRALIFLVVSELCCSRRRESLDWEAGILRSLVGSATDTQCDRGHVTSPLYACWLIHNTGIMILLPYGKHADL